MSDEETGIGIIITLLLLFTGKKKPGMGHLPGVIDPPKPQPDPIAPIPAEPGGPEIDKWTDIYPTDGRFYQVKVGDTLLGTSAKRSITKRAVSQKAYLVAKQHGLSDAEALQYATERSGADNRLTYFHAIQCDRWNDELYGTFGYGPQAVPSQHGRAIRMLPQHQKNSARLRSLDAPVRSILLRSTNDRGKGNGFAAPGAPRGHLEFLWLPEIDGDHLWTTGQVRVFSGGPPPFVQQLGIVDASGAPDGVAWGC